jgi:hypothetical protein
LAVFLSCLGFLTSRLRTLLPLPMRDSCWFDGLVKFRAAMVVGGGVEVTGATRRCREENWPQMGHGFTRME